MPRPAPSKPAPAPEVGPAVVVPVTALARGAEPTPIAISSAIKTNRQREAGRGELIGRIVDALTGKPMPSATLIADHNPIELNADAEFRVRAQGTHAELTAYADGYLTLHMKQPIGRGGEPVTIKLKPQTACLRGVVRDTDNRLPIAGARVRVGNNTVMSDAQGRYVVAGVAPTWHQVECSAPGFMNAIEVLYVTGPTLQRDLTIRSVSVATHFD